MLDLQQLESLPPLLRKSSASSFATTVDSSSSFDEKDTLLSLTDMLAENNLASGSFTGMLFGELVSSCELAADPCELLSDDAKSESDSGYQTSPAALSDDSSLDSWLFNSVSSAESSPTRTALPSISSIIPTSQTMQSFPTGNDALCSNDLMFNFNSDVSTQSVSPTNCQSALSLTSTARTPDTTPALAEPIKIKSEPMDTYGDFLSQITSTQTMPALPDSSLVQNLISASSPQDAQTAAEGSQIDILQRSPIKQEEADHLFRLKFSPHVLPPCRVCGAQATGYHYGANTCEPCKGFYHRMIKRVDKAPACLKQGKCVITSKNRGACPACRFQKCVDAGMCKENIKTGRYSYSKRSRDIIELQSSLNKTQQQISPQQQLQHQQAYEYLMQHSALSKPASPLQQNVEKDIALDSDASSQHILSTLRAARDRVAGKMLQAKFVLSDQETERIRKFSHSDQNTLDSSQSEVFLQWLHNGFKHNFWTSYIKAIPGFKNLSMQDQIVIIKRSFVEFWAVARHRLFDVENGVYYGAGGAVLRVNEILGEEQHSALFNAVKRLQNLRLTVDEACVLSAFVVLNIDTDDMQDPSAVEELKSNLLTALIFTLKQQRPRPLTTFAHITSALTELKGSCHKLSHLAIFPEDVTPPLFREVVLAMDR